MKKAISILMLILLCTLCACSSNHNNTDTDAYDDSYEQGYEDGYNDTHDGNYIENNYNEDAHDLQNFIINLVYDGKYDTVRDLQEEYPEKVNPALENEFGTTDFDIIIDYLDNESKTIIGECEICNNPVYADEIAVLPEGIDCAHHKCISSANNNDPPRINKDK